jgi:enoyl-CoA hydratase/carnithine racemase
MSRESQSLVTIERRDEIFIVRIDRPERRNALAAATWTALHDLLRCDLRVIDAAATLCMAETRIGLIPDVGGTVRLTRLVGRARALDPIATARDLRAEEALALGVVDRVAPPGRSLEVAVDLAALIAQNGPAAVRAVKRVINALPAAADPMALETEHAVDVILSGEPVEGIQAWLAKRPPRWGDGGEDPGS